MSSSSSSSEVIKIDKEVQKYIDLLQGKRSKGTYRNSNLILIDETPISIEERMKNDICPPLNYYKEYSKPIKKKSRAGKQQQDRRRIDPELMRQFMQ